MRRNNSWIISIQCGILSSHKSRIISYKRIKPSSNNRWSISRNIIFYTTNSSTPISNNSICICSSIWSHHHITRNLKWGDTWTRITINNNRRCGGILTIGRNVNFSNGLHRIINIRRNTKLRIHYTGKSDTKHHKC